MDSMIWKVYTLPVALPIFVSIALASVGPGGPTDLARNPNATQAPFVADISPLEADVPGVPVTSTPAPSPDGSPSPAIDAAPAVTPTPAPAPLGTGAPSTPPPSAVVPPVTPSPAPFFFLMIRRPPRSTPA